MIIFTSGHMWNSIRGAPYVAMGQGGKPEYFAGGFQSQYGVETQIVAAIYSLLAFSFIALTVLVPAQRDPTRQRAGCTCGVRFSWGRSACSSSSLGLRTPAIRSVFSSDRELRTHRSPGAQGWATKAIYEHCRSVKRKARNGSQ